MTRLQQIATSDTNSLRRNLYEKISCSRSRNRRHDGCQPASTYVGTWIEWQITLVDQDPVHYYQPGYLFIPFGVYSKKDVVKSKQQFMPPHVKLIQSTIEMIEPDHNQVQLEQWNCVGATIS